MTFDTRMYSISPPAEVIEQALESWGWIGHLGMRPILITAFAEVFFESPAGIWVLARWRITLATDEGKDLYFLAGLVDRAIREGRHLSEKECYDFRLYRSSEDQSTIPTCTK